MPACSTRSSFVDSPTVACSMPTAPQPVGGYTETILRIIDVVFCAFAQAAPERANGCAYGTINALSLAGIARDGRRWVMFSFFGGGHGGNPGGRRPQPRQRADLDRHRSRRSRSSRPPIRSWFTRWALRPDSGGPGRHRGGLGAIYEIELLDEDADLSVRRARHVRAAPACWRRWRRRAERDRATSRTTAWHHPPMASKMVGREAAARGQRIRIESPGGGGYGPPTQRPLEAIRRDVAPATLPARRLPATTAR